MKSTAPHFLIWKLKYLRITKKIISKKTNIFLVDKFLQYEDAAKAMLNEKYSFVNDKKLIPPSNNKNDYLSLPIYWWPDPDKKNGIPYIKKDGEINPETQTFENDRLKLGKFANDVVQLSLCEFFTNKKKYGEHASLLLQKWFIDSKTRMNPNLNYSQCAPGEKFGRSTGTIDGYQFVKIIDSIILLQHLGFINDVKFRSIKIWFEEFLDWLLTNENPLKESKRPNNHGLYYDLQVIAFSFFCERKSLAREMILKVRNERIPDFIDSNGNMPKETARTRSFHYQAYTTRAFFDVHDIAKKMRFDLKNFRANGSGTINQSFNFHSSFANNHQKWKFKQIDPFDTEHFLRNHIRVSMMRKNPDIVKRITNYIHDYPLIHDYFLYPSLEHVEDFSPPKSSSKKIVQTKKNIKKNNKTIQSDQQKIKLSKEKVLKKEKNQKVSYVAQQYKEFQAMSNDDLALKYHNEIFLKEINYENLSTSNLVLSVAYIKSISTTQWSRSLLMAKEIYPYVEKNIYIKPNILYVLNLIIVRSLHRSGNIDEAMNLCLKLVKNPEYTKFYFFLSKIVSNSVMKDTFLKLAVDDMKITNKISFSEVVYMARFYHKNKKILELQNLFSDFNKYLLANKNHIDHDLIWLFLYFNIDKKLYISKIKSYYESLNIRSPFLENDLLPLNKRLKNKLKLDLSLDHSIAKDKPLVTVIMTSFNSEDTIKNSIISVLNQSYTNIKIHIIDDLSTDKTLEIIKELASLDSRIKYSVNNENIGTYRSKNLALLELKNSTDYFTFHDSDDWMHYDRIKIHMQTHEENRECILSNSHWLRFTDEDIIDTSLDGGHLLHQNPCSTFFKSDLINDIGVFDTVRASADSEFFQRCLKFYGESKIETLEIPLSLGLRDQTSLTTSGKTGMFNGVSLARDQYKESWSRFHELSVLEDSKHKLTLDNDPQNRKFSSPDDLL